jgi:hypothetical protein
LSLFSMDSRIICYPPKTYFEKVNVPRATTKLWYDDINFKHIREFTGAYPKKIGHGEQGL